MKIKHWILKNTNNVITHTQNPACIFRNLFFCIYFAFILSVVQSIPRSISIIKIPTLFRYYFFLIRQQLAVNAYFSDYCNKPKQGCFILFSFVVAVGSVLVSGYIIKSAWWYHIITLSSKLRIIVKLRVNYRNNKKKVQVQWFRYIHMSDALNVGSGVCVGI